MSFVNLCYIVIFVCFQSDPEQTATEENVGGETCQKESSTTGETGEEAGHWGKGKMRVT